MVRCLDNQGPHLDLGFNVLSLDRNTLYGYLLSFFKRLGADGTLQINPSQLLDLLIDIDAAYQPAPYHSFYHAADTVAVLYYTLTHLGAAKYLSSIDTAQLLLAALCHDIGHPGFNNLYHVNFCTELAQRYNNTSVLENHSVALTRELLQKHGLRQATMPVLEDLILSTDMATHYKLQNQAQRLQIGAGQLQQSWQRLSFCRILLHAADLSNAVRPWSVSKHWSDLIVKEFFRQGDAEKAAQKPISPGMDRTQSTQPEISIKFGELVAKPFFESLAHLLPPARVFLCTLNTNCQAWAKLSEDPTFCCHPTDPFPVDSYANHHYHLMDVSGRPMLATIERRVSVAAGTIVIPDQPHMAWRDDQKKRFSVVGLPSSVTKPKMGDVKSRKAGEDAFIAYVHSTKRSTKFIVFAVFFPCLVYAFWMRFYPALAFPLMA